MINVNFGGMIVGGVTGDIIGKSTFQIINECDINEVYGVYPINNFIAAKNKYKILKPTDYTYFADSYISMFAAILNIGSKNPDPGDLFYEYFNVLLSNRKRKATRGSDLCYLLLINDIGLLSKNVVKTNILYDFYEIDKYSFFPFSYILPLFLLEDYKVYLDFQARLFNLSYKVKKSQYILSSIFYNYVEDQNVIKLKYFNDQIRDSSKDFCEELMEGIVDTLQMVNEYDDCLTKAINVYHKYGNIIGLLACSIFSANRYNRIGTSVNIDFKKIEHYEKLVELAVSFKNMLEKSV